MQNFRFSSDFRIFGTWIIRPTSHIDRFSSRISCGKGFLVGFFLGYIIEKKFFFLLLLLILYTNSVVLISNHLFLSFFFHFSLAIPEIPQVLWFSFWFLDGNRPQDKLLLAALSRFYFRTDLWASFCCAWCSWFSFKTEADLTFYFIFTERIDRVTPEALTKFFFLVGEINWGNFFSVKVDSATPEALVKFFLVGNFNWRNI